MSKFIIYNDTLDPLLWDKDGNLKTDVAQTLLRIAQDFYEGLEIKPIIHDILLIGSAASYNYSVGSDIDIHLVIDFKELNMSEKDAEDYVGALKANWNNKHDIHVKGKNVEVYIQDIKHVASTNGVYSLLNSNWIKKPTKENTGILDKELILKKYKDMTSKICVIDDTKDKNLKISKIKEILTDLYAMRQVGLDASGELSAENIVFKILRHKGFIDKLKKIKDELYDKSLSLDEKIKIDNVNGIGAVPWNQEVDYRGFKKYMTPDEFLGLVLPMYDKSPIDFYIDLINKNGMASPWLQIKWEENRGWWQVTGHEGRHRMSAIEKINPNEKVEVHLFPTGMRARDLTQEMIDAPIKREMKEALMESNEEITVKKEKINGKITRYYLMKGLERLGKLTVQKDYIENYYVIVSFIIDNKDYRGKGYGYKLIKALLDDIEFSDKEIVVKPLPYYDDEVTVSELVSMYKKFGFVPWDKETGYMIYDRNNIKEMWIGF